MKQLQQDIPSTVIDEMLFTMISYAFWAVVVWSVQFSETARRITASPVTLGLQQQQITVEPGKYNTLLYNTDTVQYSISICRMICVSEVKLTTVANDTRLFLVLEKGSEQYEDMLMYPYLKILCTLWIWERLAIWMGAAGYVLTVVTLLLVVLKQITFILLTYCWLQGSRVGNSTSKKEWLLQGQVPLKQYLQGVEQFGVEGRVEQLGGLVRFQREIFYKGLAVNCVQDVESCLILLAQELRMTQQEIRRASRFFLVELEMSYQWQMESFPLISSVMLMSWTSMRMMEARMVMSVVAENTQMNRLRILICSKY